MNTAYEREVALLPIVLEMEQKGVPLSHEVHDMYDHWQDVFDQGEDYIENLCGDGIKVGSKAMFQHFRNQGLIDESKIQFTEKGNPRFGREFLHDLVTDEKLKQVLLMRSKLEKIIGTYLRPWSQAAIKNDFRTYPFFSQTRGDDDYGTRTGRFSSNMQQVPKEPEKGMPNLRSMIVAEKGHTLLQRDFSGQEIRVAAHYANEAWQARESMDCKILQAYRDNPSLDAHEFVQAMVKETTGVELKRKQVKIISFMKLYGGGPKAAMGGMGVDYDTALEFYKAYDKALPEFKELADWCTVQVEEKEQIVTWGGRAYGVEMVSVPGGRKFGDHQAERKKALYYKLINVLVQGSSADMTKEAMLRYQSRKHPDARIMLQVHDELVVTCPEHLATTEMEVLRWAMDEIPGWDVPLRSDGGIGHNFGELEDCG